MPRNTGLVALISCSPLLYIRCFCNLLNTHAARRDYIRDSIIGHPPPPNTSSYPNHQHDQRLKCTPIYVDTLTRKELARLRIQMVAKTASAYQGPHRRKSHCQSSKYPVEPSASEHKSSNAHCKNADKNIPRILGCRKRRRRW